MSVYVGVWQFGEMLYLVVQNLGDKWGGPCMSMCDSLGRCYTLLLRTSVTSEEVRVCWRVTVWGDVILRGVEPRWQVRRSVYVGVWQFGEMLYLVVQNLGLWHVTQRYDRASYVRVITANLLPAYRADLSKLEPSSRLLNTFQQPYDYASLMHFPAKVCRTLLYRIAIISGSSSDYAMISALDFVMIRYDTTILMCAGKLTDASLIYRTEPRSENIKMKLTRKWICSEKRYRTRNREVRPINEPAHTALVLCEKLRPVCFMLIR